MVPSLPTASTDPLEQTPVETAAATLTPTGTIGATATPSRSTPTPSAGTTPAPEFEFIRWSGGYKVLALEPGGEVWAEQDVHVDMVAAVLDKVEVDGVEWIRVQYGSDRPGDRVHHGWAPSEADIDRGGGIHVDPVYEYVVPECPHDFTIGDLGGMTPLQALYCFGSQKFTVSPLLVRNDGTELDYFVDGQPEWLAIGDGQWAHWFPGYEERGAVPIYVDPASDIEVPEQTWVEITGQIDYPAAEACEMTSTEPEVLDVRNVTEAQVLCRGHFVVTGVRRLNQAEIPQPPIRPTPGPVATTVDVAVREFDGPFSTRISPSTVWTGTEMIVWGGESWKEDWSHASQNEGAAYDPVTREWRDIPSGPLSPRSGATASWTGTEMLVWGGHTQDAADLTDGAAYNPATDTWRRIADGPLRGSHDNGSVWTGTEWWVAAGRRNSIDVAAYDPASDRWRTLPSTDRPAYRQVQLFWTGDEALLVDTENGLFRMTPDGSAWQEQPTMFIGPAAWTGELLVGVREEQLGPGPFQSETWFFPVGWDPATGEEVELAKPPSRVWNPTWTGRYLLFAEYRLALDPQTGEWFWLDFDKAPTHVDRSGPAIVWAGDRLLVWGGWSACPGYMDGYEIGYELIPHWASDTAAEAIGAPARGIGAGARVLPDRPVPSSSNLAC